MLTITDVFCCDPNPITVAYIFDISLGGRQDIYTKRLVDSVVSRARDDMTSSCVVRGIPTLFEK